MNATMIDMELIKADTLTADALEIGDLIGIDDEILEVISIEDDSTGDNYTIEVINDYGEKELLQLYFDEEVDLYVSVE
jgi:hypothetical protein